MRVLYGVVGEGLGHATRSRVVAERLLERGHEVKMVASGQALPYLQRYLPDVEEIWGTSFVLEQGSVKKWKTFSTNVRGGAKRVPASWRTGADIARAYGPDLMLSDFDAFSYLYAKTVLKPVISIGNIDMVGRCKHGAAILRGVRPDYLTARAYVNTKIPRADHYVIATLFRPRVRLKRTTLAPPILRPEILEVEPERGDHLLVYGRIGDTAIAALDASGLPCLVYGARDGVTEDVQERRLVYRPFSNEGFIDDLRRSRGVIASAGHSLMSEAVYLHKPMLALPLAGQFEQEMNARYLEQMNYGSWATELDEAALERFLERESVHDRALAEYRQDGNVETLRTIEHVIADVMARRRRW
jgi:uncharacterized protein (TIGR00661 family)